MMLNLILVAVSFVIWIKMDFFRDIMHIDNETKLHT